MTKYAVLGIMLLIMLGIGLPLMMHPDSKLQQTEQESEYTRFYKECVHVLPPMEPFMSPGAVDGVSGAGELNPEELVIGVTLNGESRAYPLNMIDAPERKVINDVVGGEPILVTWCDNCHTAAVFSRRIDGKEEVFACTGMLWQRTLVMYDVATHSFWSHLLGTCVAGERSGKALLSLDATITTWSNWHAEYPGTSVVLDNRESDRLQMSFYQNQHKPEEFAFGVRQGGEAQSWTFDLLLEQPVVNTQVGEQPVVLLFDPQRYTARMFVAMVEGRPLQFRRTDQGIQDDVSGGTWNLLTGKALTGEYTGRHLQPVPGVTCFVKYWEAFFPDSTVHRRDGV